MIELLSGFPDGVVAFRAKGRATKDDYDAVVIPAVEAGFGKRDKLRCYYELGSDFSGMDIGAVWQDFRVGMGHFVGWERVAVVTDTGWIRHAVGVFQFLIPGEVRVFSTREAAEARQWIAAAVR